VRAARRLAAEVLAESRYPGDVETVLLLVSELVTNAVRHAATPFELRLSVEATEVVVTVVDHDRTHLPHLRNPGPEETSGRGLQIVDQLAASWGSEAMAGDAKGVWFRCVTAERVSPTAGPAARPAGAGPAGHPSARPARR
jgi:two-component sensor histidine kinase